MSEHQLLEKIYKEINELKNNINFVNSKFEQLNIELNTKIDILCNFKPAQQKSNSVSNDNKKKVPSKMIYIKNEIKQNKEKYIDILYTEEEYEKCVEAIEQKNLKTKKTEEDKLKQLTDLIYKEIINKNPTYKEQATQIHNKFKKEFNEEDIEIISETS